MARHGKKNVYHKFKERHHWQLTHQQKFDQITELEAQTIYESFMKECLACETAYKSKISTLDIPGLPDCLLGSPEQSALPRANATLLTKAMLEKVANEHEARQQC